MGSLEAITAAHEAGYNEGREDAANRVRVVLNELFSDVDALYDYEDILEISIKAASGE